MIRVQATVERQMLGSKPSHIFHVYVDSPDRPHVRKYIFICDDEDEAAQKGLRAYEREFDPDPKLSV